MRIFIHNVDTYLGKVLVSELRRADGGSHRVFGTVAKSLDGAPKVVKRIVGREDPKRSKKMIETIQSCKVVVLDLFNSTLEDLHFVIKALKVDPTTSPPKPTGELEGDVTFILISSAMVWAETKVDREDGVLKESDYPARTPVAGSKYEQWKEMEDLAMSCFTREGSTVKALVVAGGALYGEGEDAFGKLFKDAWCGDKEHVILGQGQNRIPTVHVRDLSRLVRQLMDNSSIVAADTPYFLAVDQPPAPEGQKPMPPTQAEIVQGIVDEMCDPYQVPNVSEWPAQDVDDQGEGVLSDLQETMMLDLRMEPAAIMLDPEFASLNDPPGWYCREGLLKNIRKIAGEFCKERKLRAMRMLIGGPPASGKSTLAQNVSEHFRIPRVDLPRTGANFDAICDMLSTRVCRYRGYVLDAGEAGFGEVERLLRFDVEAPAGGEDEEGGGGGEGEEGEEPAPKQFTRQLNEEICPSFVVVTQAPIGLCEGRYRMAHGEGSIQEFRNRMNNYTESNLNDGVHSLADFFQDVARKSVANLSVFNLPVAGKDEEDMFESTRIYMEREGRPFNYLATEEEVASEILERRAARAAEAAEAIATEARRRLESSTVQQGESKRRTERARIIAEHLAEQQKLREMPLREYLMEYMIPSLTEGLIEVCKVLPDNPADYLANYLEEHTTPGPVLEE
mmetsp:Transcript_4797/g.13359  ORF Transcript_4797/g.13359 Transcript_4797/m.13359 type:complete len:677 (-) Transcript_4797:103-2133(-)